MTEKKMATELLKLVEIMATLRSPEGCPWDREQTPESLKPYILEEAYELLEAIDSKDAAEICDELGDLLLQVVFIAQIFNEQKKFGLAEVA
ncbi:MAG: MazG nucleotide pyrophosphohydrolase domain-containing protein, partial [Thermodesulfobacteriota bacterium]|nr:MazG nucleotide pyrophosphohydrolase domain-containing protein [Thermodesulfobacteriota bacterium]